MEFNLNKEILKLLKRARSNLIGVQGKFYFKRESGRCIDKAIELLEAKPLQSQLKQAREQGQAEGIEAMADHNMSDKFHGC